MQTITGGYRGLGLLIDVNNDRMLSVLIVAAALAAVGWVGVEYAHSLIVEDAAPVTTAFL
jgi:hypothetical protein